MLKRTLLPLIVPLLLFRAAAFGQFTPPPSCQAALTGKLICVLPQEYGPSGLTLANPNHFAHFTSSFQSNFAPLTLSVGTQLSLLSLASPASGVLFTFDRSLGVVSRSTESYGPILTERAETIGRHRLYLAGTYQYYGFSSIDDLDLKHVPSTFSHVEFPVRGSIPLFEHDFITTDNRIDLKVHQFTLYGSFGLTSRVDVSVAVPILDVRMGVTTNAHINRVAPPNPSDPSAGEGGQFHYFRTGEPDSVDATFHNASSAAGLGDVLFRVKGTVLKHERAGVALGLDIRTPTGDEADFLGAGAIGVKPFIAASYRARVSPHANIGFEYNGSSILAGNVATGTTAKLPNQFFYSGGVDIGISKKLTAAVDFLGQRLSNTVRVHETTFTDEFGETHSGVSQSVLTRDSLTMADLSLGAKYSPFGNLLLTGNVLLRLNKAGLRAKAVPLVGISYTF